MTQKDSYSFDSLWFIESSASDISSTPLRPSPQHLPSLQSVLTQALSLSTLVGIREEMEEAVFPLGPLWVTEH